MPLSKKVKVMLAVTALAIGSLGIGGYIWHENKNPSAMKYAQQQIPSLASHFSGFGALDRQTEVYIGGVEYVLTNAGYASSALEEKVIEDTLDNRISPDEVNNIQNLDGDQFSNKEEVVNGTNILDKFNKLPADLESLAVLNNKLYAVVAGNGGLSYAFGLQNFKSIIRELTNAPYADELIDRINAVDSKENVSEAWNSKVRREDDVLFAVIPQYQTGFDGNSAEAWQFRFDNGSYHLQLWSDGNSILPLDNAGMKEWFPNKADRDFVYMHGLWVPNSMATLDLTKYKMGTSSFQTLRNNMDLILGVQKINDLSFEDMRGRIVSVDQDHTIKSYAWPDSWNTSDFKEAEFSWGRQTTDGLNGFTHTLPDYGKNFVPVLDANWDSFRLIKLAYGLGIIDMAEGKGDKAEQWDCAIAQIYTKSLGGAAFNLNARYPEYTGVKGVHQALGIATSAYLLPLLPEDKLVFKGQVIGPYSAIDGVRLDGIPYLLGPNSIETVWTHPLL